MAISDKLRNFLTGVDTQHLLAENDLEGLFYNAYVALELSDYKKLVLLLYVRYDDMIGELKELYPQMFSEFDLISDVELNPEVVMIPSQCFESSNIKSIDASNVRTIGHRAFYNCRNLTDILLSEAIIIGSNAFTGCTSLTKISLPTTVQKINSKAFSHCPNLKEIHYQGTKEECSQISWGISWDGTFDSSAIKVICTDGEM